MPVPKLYINILNVKVNGFAFCALRVSRPPIPCRQELYGFVNSSGGVVIGANETLSSLLDFFTNNTSLAPKLGQMATFMKRIASASIRNVGCWAGNLALANQKVCSWRGWNDLVGPAV
jgi:hypothetical protein